LAMHIENRLQRARAVGHVLNTIGASSEASPAGVHHARVEAESMLAYGFSAIAFRSSRGGLRVMAGSMAESPTGQARLTAPVPAFLQWRSGFVLRVELGSGRGGGTCIIEQPLPQQLHIAPSYASAEMVLCARQPLKA